MSFNALLVELSLNTRILLLALVLVFALPKVSASAEPAEPSAAARIRGKLVAVYPTFPKPSVIKQSPVAGLYEVVIAGQVKYVDESAEFLIDGSVVQLSNKANLTSQRMAELARVDWQKLPHQLAFTSRINGTGSRKLFVFADPNCGYCKKLERSLAELKDITVYTVQLPILGPDSLARSTAIACAPNPAAAWNAWMQDHVEPPAAAPTCHPQFERAAEFAKSHGINATPAIFLPDSTKLPGAVDTPELERLIAGGQKD